MVFKPRVCFILFAGVLATCCAPTPVVAPTTAAPLSVQSKETPMLTGDVS